MRNSDNIQIKLFLLYFYGILILAAILGITLTIPIGGADMPVQRSRVELGQHKNPIDARMDAITDRNVNQAVFAADRHRLFRAKLRQRKKPRTLPTT